MTVSRESQMQYIQNPDFPTDEPSLNEASSRLHAAPQGLERPLLVIGGYRSPQVLIAPIASRLRSLLKPQPSQFLAVTVPLATSIAGAARTVSLALTAAGRQHETFDVIGFSMGGLVARAMAAGMIPGIEPLRIARLFTLATPHRGAVVAKVVAPDSAAIDMTPGSPFLRSLDDALPQRTYDLHCYSYLRDWWVGTHNTAPEGFGLHWVDPAGLASRMLAHFTICRSRPVALDVALKLKGLKTLSVRATEPPRVGPFTRSP